MDRHREDRLVASENRCGSVPLVDISIYYHRSFNRTVGLHLSDSDCYIVNHAEPFAMIGIRMMESAAEIRGKALFQRAPRGQNRAARGEPARLNQFCRIRHFHA